MGVPGPAPSATLDLHPTARPTTPGKSHRKASNPNSIAETSGKASHKSQTHAAGLLPGKAHVQQPPAFLPGSMDLHAHADLASVGHPLGLKPNTLMGSEEQPPRPEEHQPPRLVIPEVVDLVGQASPVAAHALADASRLSFGDQILSRALSGADRSPPPASGLAPAVTTTAASVAPLLLPAYGVNTGPPPPESSTSSTALTVCASSLSHTTSTSSSMSSAPVVSASPFPAPLVSLAPPCQPTPPSSTFVFGSPFSPVPPTLPSAALVTEATGLHPSPPPPQPVAPPSLCPRSSLTSTQPPSSAPTPPPPSLQVSSPAAASQHRPDAMDTAPTLSPATAITPPPSDATPAPSVIAAVHSVPVSIPLTMLGCAYSTPPTSTTASHVTPALTAESDRPGSLPSVITLSAPPSGAAEGAVAGPAPGLSHPLRLPSSSTLHPPHPPSPSLPPLSTPIPSSQPATVIPHATHPSSQSLASLVEDEVKCLEESPSTSTTKTTSTSASPAPTSVIMSTSKLLFPSVEAPAASGPRASAIVSPSCLNVAPEPIQPNDLLEVPVSPQPSQPSQPPQVSLTPDPLPQSQWPETEEPRPPPDAIVKQLHQLTALSLLQSSQPVTYVRHTNCFPKKENVVSRLDLVERRRREMQQKRRETRSRQTKQPRFFKHWARQDLVVPRRDLGVHQDNSCPTALPVATSNGSNGHSLAGAALSDESNSDSEEWWDDPNIDIMITAGPPAPLVAGPEKLDFLGYLGLTTLKRRKYLELQRLLNEPNRIASALMEDLEFDSAKAPEELQLPLPDHPPEVVYGGADYTSKVQFLLELELKATTRKEREDSDAFWLASEAEKSRRGGSCKVTKYLSAYREALHKIINRTKRNPILSAAPNDLAVPPRTPVPSICDKLLGLSFSRVNGVSASSAQSYLPLVRSALPHVLDAVLPVMLQQPNGEVADSESESSVEAENIEKEEWPGIEAIFSSYMKYHNEQEMELQLLRSYVTNLGEQISTMNNEVSAMEQQIKDLTMVKTSQEVERMRLQSTLDSLSGFLKGLKTNLRYKKPC